MTTITATRPPASPDEASSWLLERSAWTDGDLAAAAVPVVDVPLVTVGGGLGSLALVDVLRLAGAPPPTWASSRPRPTPSETYRYLATNSQIDRGRPPALRRRLGHGQHLGLPQLRLA